MHNPPVIVLDEPTVGLDPRQIIEVRNLIRSLAGEHTIILSTHILPEVSVTCDRITIINQGEIIATDSPENLVERLTGRDGYRVELKSDVERGLSVLRSIPGVAAAKVLSAEDLSAGHYRFEVATSAGTSDLGSAIAATIVGQGFELFELSRNRASLEDVFINLTTQESPAATEDSHRSTAIEAPAKSAKAQDVKAQKAKAKRAKAEVPNPKTDSSDSTATDPTATIDMTDSEGGQPE